MLGTGIAQATLITVTGDPNDAVGATVVLNESITMTVETAGDWRSIGFVGVAWPDDGTVDSVLAGGLSITVNGLTISESIWRWQDNNLGGVGGYPSIGFLVLDGPLAVKAEDIVVISAGTVTSTSTTSEFNLWTSGDYETILAAQDGTLLAGAIPEPAVIVLISMMGGGMLVARRIFEMGWSTRLK